MDDRDLRILKENDNRIVRIRTYDGEIMIAKVRFVSQADEDLIYDLISTTKESQYEKRDEQPAYLIPFKDIESVETVESSAAGLGPNAAGSSGKTG
jgi:hypothetical protein